MLTGICLLSVDRENFEYPAYGLHIKGHVMVWSSGSRVLLFVVIEDCMMMMKETHGRMRAGSGVVSISNDDFEFPAKDLHISGHMTV